MQRSRSLFRVSQRISSPTPAHSVLLACSPVITVTADKTSFVGGDTVTISWSSQFYTPTAGDNIQVRGE